MQTDTNLAMRISDNSAFRAGIKKGYETYGPVFEKTLRRLAIDLQQQMLKKEDLTKTLIKDVYEAVKEKEVKFHMVDKFHKEIFETLVKSWKHSELLPNLFDKTGNLKIL